MKKLFTLTLIAGAFTFANNAVACEINERTTSSVRDVVVAKGGWPISDEKCAFLGQRNLILHVSAMRTVLTGTSVGWASVRLVDVNNVISDAGTLNTRTNTSPSMDIAEDMMYAAIKDAIAKLDFEQAASEIKKYQKAIKAR